MTTNCDYDSIMMTINCMFVIMKSTQDGKKTSLVSGSSVLAFISEILPEFEKKYISNSSAKYCLGFKRKYSSNKLAI